MSSSQRQQPPGKPVAWHPTVCVSQTPSGAPSAFCILRLASCLLIACVCLASLVPASAALADDQSDLSALAGAFHKFFDAGRYREAEPYAKQMLSIADRSFSDQPRIVAQCLDFLALVYKNLGRYAEADPLHQRGLEIREKAFGPDHPLVAISLNYLGLLYTDQSRYAEAEPLFQRALRIREKALGPDHLDVAYTLNNLAMLYRDLGRFAEAEALYKRSLRVQEKELGPNHVEVATVLNNLAILYTDLGRYAEAEPFHKRSLWVHEKAFGADHPEVAISLGNLAILYRKQGRYAEAEPLYKRALRVQQKAFGPEHPVVATSLNNLALLYRYQHRFAEAEPLFTRALGIREKLLGPDHTEVAGCLNNLALLYRDQLRYAEAEPLYLRSIKINEAKLGPDHPDVALTLSNLAQLYKDMGENAKSESLYQQSLKINETSLGPEHPEVARLLMLLAELYHAMGQGAKAELLAERAVAIYDLAKAAPGDRFRAYDVLSRIKWALGRQARAVEDLSRALDFSEQARGKISGGEHERAGYFSQFENAFERMVSWQVELNDQAAALQASERARARSLVDQLQLGQVDLLAGLPANEANELRRRDAEAKTNAAGLEKQLELIERQPGLSAEDRESRRDRLQAELGRARETLVEVYRDIRSASPAYRISVGRDFKPAGLAEIQSCLHHDEALALEYLFGAEAGYLFVIPPEGEPRLVKLMVDAEQAQALGLEPGPLTIELLQQILSVDGTEVPKLLSDPNTVPRAFGRLASLWKLLIPQAERQALTSGEVKQLVVIPNGPLALLPFETLIVEPGESPKYLLDVGPPILYAPSATVLLNLAGRSAKDGKTQPSAQPVLTVANPVYGSSQRTPTTAASALDAVAAHSRYGAMGGQLAPLPHTGTESAWVADVYKQQGIASAGLVAGLATEANVRFNVAGRRVLHFACHGLADQAYGNFFGALALTPGKQGVSNPADDGFLTLPEIYDLNLKGCELAILSACETNYGPQQKGEGVWALSRGFLVAGARRVVASNWLVDDEAAASLISYFCADAAKDHGDGEAADHAAALHRAKRWVRQQEKWRSPYYWGTFVLVGPN